MSVVILNDFFGKTHATDIEFHLYFSNYLVKKLNDAIAEDKNFLYLYYRPEDFHEMISTQRKEFYKQVKDKNCNVLIYHEGFDLFRIPEIFENPLPLEIDNEPYWKVINFFHNHGINEDRLYFLTSAIGYEQDLELLKQRKIPWINKIKPVQAKFCTLNSTMLWGPQQKETKIKEKFFEKTYGSLAGCRPALHRYEFTRKLWKENLINDGLVSMCYMINGDGEFESHLPIIFDNQHNLWQKNIDENYIFQKIFLWISNETHMDNKLTLFSEKTIKAILYMNPFVINGDTGTLKYLKDLGYKTFEEFWDESYDLIENRDERQNKIINIIKDLKNKDLQELYNKMRPILEHNRDLLMNKDWLKTLHNFLQS
jgi:hypothetical protein